MLDTPGGRRHTRRIDQRAHRLYRHATKLACVALLAVIAAGLVALPFALASVLGSFHSPSAGGAYRVSGDVAPAPGATRVNLEAVAMSEVNRTVTFRVTGERRCPSGCAPEELQLTALAANPRGSQGPQPSATVEIPARTVALDTSVTLPVAGRLIDYPFDTYSLTLGVRETGSAATRAADLDLSIGEDVPRLVLERPVVASPGAYPGGEDYVDTLAFSRPLYLQILAVLLVLMISVAAICAVVLRPFDQMVPTIGVIVLGVWGVRSLLVGNYPPDATGVDLVLTSMIVLLLMIVMVRAARFLWPRAFGAESSPGTEETRSAEPGSEGTRG